MKQYFIYNDLIYPSIQQNWVKFFPTQLAEASWVYFNFTILWVGKFFKFGKFFVLLVAILLGSEVRAVEGIF